MATNIKFHRITATPGSNIKTDQDYVKGDVYFIKSATGNTGKVYICTVTGRGAAATLEDYSVDTNTWRPVENNLTSTSTDSSLSAAMGKTLNESITTLSNSLSNLYVDANVMAVDTGDIINDATVEYTTKSYVDGLVGDINSVLESIING